MLQSYALGEGICLGMMMGVVYDLLRVLRVRLTLLTQALDLLFWAMVTLVIFLWSQGVWGGRIRLYAVLSLMVGAGLYFTTFTVVIQWIGFRFADLTHFLIQVLCLPLRLAIGLEKKIKKFTKNLFLFWWKWYKIDGMTELMNDSHLMRQPQSRGGEDIANQKGQHMDETSSSGRADLSSRGIVDRVGRNSGNRTYGNSPTRRSRTPKRIQ